MTSLTPARDAALKAIGCMKVDLAEELAGDPIVALQAQLTVDLNTAATLALADCSDREISTYEALKILEISFANAIASIAGSTCAELSSQGKVACIFISHVAQRCAEVIEDSEPGANHTVEIDRSHTGTA